MSEFKRGDLVITSLDPTLGREQKKRRPCIVVSGDAYNRKSGMIVICPITSTAKGYPFEAPISGAVKGVVLVDQIRCIDPSARKVVHIEGDHVASHSTILHVQGLLDALLLR